MWIKGNDVVVDVNLGFLWIEGGPGLKGGPEIPCAVMFVAPDGRDFDVVEGTWDECHLILDRIFKELASGTSFLDLTSEEIPETPARVETDWQS